MSVGQELLDAANGAYRRKQSAKKGANIYKGLYYAGAIAAAMQQTYTEGKRRSRHELAEALVIKTFDKARATEAERMERVAACVGPQGQMMSTGDGDNELTLFAQELWDALNTADRRLACLYGQTYELVSTLIDPQMIISFIMQLITMIRNCKTPPTPAPATI